MADHASSCDGKSHRNTKSDSSRDDDNLLENSNVGADDVSSWGRRNILELELQQQGFLACDASLRSEDSFITTTTTTNKNKGGGDQQKGTSILDNHDRLQSESFTSQRLIELTRENLLLDDFPMRSERSSDNASGDDRGSTLSLSSSTRCWSKLQQEHDQYYSSSTSSERLLRLPRDNNLAATAPDSIMINLMDCETGRYDVDDENNHNPNPKHSLFKMKSSSKNVKSKRKSKKKRRRQKALVKLQQQELQLQRRRRQLYIYLLVLLVVCGLVLIATLFRSKSTQMRKESTAALAPALAPARAHAPARAEGTGTADYNNTTATKTTLNEDRSSTTKPAAMEPNVTPLSAVPHDSKQERLEQILSSCSYSSPIVSPSSTTTAATLAKEWLVHTDHFTGQLLFENNYNETTNTACSSSVAKTILQRYALVLFHFATSTSTTTLLYNSGDDPSATKYLANWLTKEHHYQHVCEWDGVGCQFQLLIATNTTTPTVTTTTPTTTYRRILHFDRSNRGLQGTIPTEFIEIILPELLDLDLSHNQLHGTLPPIRRSNSKNITIETTTVLPLELLFLQNNSFTGSIPNDYFGATATHLYKLDLSNNRFSGNLHPPSQSIFQMQNLRRLALHHNMLTGTLPTTFFRLLPPTITEVLLDHNHLQGTIAITVTASLGSMSHLEILLLGNNNFTGTFPAVESLERLVQLNIRQNALSGTLPQILPLNLEHLAADHNSFASTLPIDWSAASKLTSVFLNSNYLFSSIPASWGTLSQLEELWISNNALTGSIPSELGQLERLYHLFLHNNRLSQTIPSTLENLHRLESLKIHHNDLVGTIGEQFCMMRHLYNLAYTAADCKEAIECQCCDQCF